MRTTPLILIGSFISSWAWLVIIFYLLEVPNELNESNSLLAATIIAPFLALLISLPIIIITSFTQSFQKKPVKAVLLVTVIAAIGILIVPHLYLAVPILLSLAAFLAIFHKDIVLDINLDIKNVGNWPNESLLKSFSRANIRNGDRFTIFVEVEKRGLAKELKIKPNTVLFKITNCTPSLVPFWIAIVGMLVGVNLLDFYDYMGGLFIGIISLAIWCLHLLGIRAHKLTITNSNIVVKKTVFFLITTSNKKLPIVAHENNGIYFSTLLVCSYFLHSGVLLEAILTFKKIPKKDELVTCHISDGFFHPLPMRRPLKNSKIPLCKSQMLTVMDIIPKNLSKLLLLRKVPFFYENMPSGDPIFDGDQLLLNDTSPSIYYEMFSLKRPIIETPDFQYFCNTFTLPHMLTQDVLELYDHDWLRILFYAQHGSIPLPLSTQSFKQKASISGDYIFSTGTLPKKNKLEVIFSTMGISLIGQNNLLVKAYNYNEIKITPATSYESFFELNLPGHPLRLPCDGSLPFKQLIKLSKSTT